MRFIKTAAGDEQIKIRTTPENEAPIISKIVPLCGAAQASPVKSTATNSPIVLNTMPYSASGPGGPSLTSRKH
jgi:hypothetical protein